ncbi:uncharacterized protein [Miscanthus floridulus]|uniref:uncharacterized protein n=1 Tax=Miscanthus floridulus TaxID=154761 RepID=UPI003458C1A6
MTSGPVRVQHSQHRQDSAGQDTGHQGLGTCYAGTPKAPHHRRSYNLMSHVPIRAASHIAPIAANKTQTGQNKGGDTTVSFTTTKALRDVVAKKRALSKRNQQAGKAQEQDRV